MNRLQLFSYFRSSAAFRVRIALALKGVPFDYKPVHLVKDGGQQHREEFKSVNPLGEVPALVDGDFSLGQSMAILFYLDDLYPSPKLFPSSAKDLARVVQICETVNCGMHPLQNLKVLQELEKRFGANQEAKDQWVQHWMTKGLEGLERILVTTAGTYAYGGEITAADLFIVPQSVSARRFKVNTERFPTFRRVAESCMKLSAFQAADPLRQPDTPADFKGD
jgi:maleylpyruvate isomerase